MFLYFIKFYNKVDGKRFNYMEKGAYIKKS